jgi:oligoendopeptidase F
MTGIADGSAPEFPRRYVAADADPGVWATAENYYRELADRPLGSREELEIWLYHWSELEAFLDEERARRRIEAARLPQDEGRQARYVTFLRTIEPAAQTWRQRLAGKLLEQALRFELPPVRYEVLLRRARAVVELYREANLPLEAEEACLIAEYRRLVATMSCEYAGREQTLAQMAWYLEDPSRKAREEAWRLINERFYQDFRQLDELYAQLVRLRDRIARQAGCADYVEYVWKLWQRVDYTRADCLRLHEAVSRVVAPQVQKLDAAAAERLNLKHLHPWDLLAPPDGAPLRPFATSAELIRACSQVFYRIDPEFGRIFDTFERRGLLDLEPRKDKAGRAFHEVFAEQRSPFIFMNATGCEHDVWTLLHQAGCAFGIWACRNEPLLAYRRACDLPEAAELAGIGLQFLALPHLEHLFAEHKLLAVRRFFERLLRLFARLARMDAFEHYVYTHAQASPEEWKDCWQRLGQRFGLSAALVGFEQFERHGWQQHAQLFEAPLAGIAHGIGLLAAIQLWQQVPRDCRLGRKQDDTPWQQAVALYRNGLALGAARPAGEVLAAAGCRLELTQRSVRRAAGAITEYLLASGAG